MTISLQSTPSLYVKPQQTPAKNQRVAFGSAEPAKDVVSIQFSGDVEEAKETKGADKTKEEKKTDNLETQKKKYKNKKTWKTVLQWTGGVIALLGGVAAFLMAGPIAAAIAGGVGLLIFLANYLIRPGEEPKADNGNKVGIESLPEAEQKLCKSLLETAKVVNADKDAKTVVDAAKEIKDSFDAYPEEGKAKETFAKLSEEQRQNAVELVHVFVTEFNQLAQKEDATDATKELLKALKPPVKETYDRFGVNDKDRKNLELKSEPAEEPSAEEAVEEVSSDDVAKGGSTQNEFVLGVTNLRNMISKESPEKTIEDAFEKIRKIIVNFSSEAEQQNKAKYLYGEIAKDSTRMALTKAGNGLLDSLNEKLKALYTKVGLTDDFVKIESFIQPERIDLANEPVEVFVKQFQGQPTSFRNDDLEKFIDKLTLDLKAKTFKANPSIFERIKTLQIKPPLPVKLPAVSDPHSMTASDPKTFIVVVPKNHKNNDAYNGVPLVGIPVPLEHAGKDLNELGLKLTLPDGIKKDDIDVYKMSLKSADQQYITINDGQDQTSVALEGLKDAANRTGINLLLGKTKAVLYKLLSKASKNNTTIIKENDNKFVFVFDKGLNTKGQIDTAKIIDNDNIEFVLPKK